MQELSVLSALAWGLTTLAAAWVLLDFLLTPPARPAPQSMFEIARRQRLRAKSLLYRWFEPAFDKLARRNAGTSPKRLEKLRRCLQLSPEELPWTPEEYIAFVQVQSGLAAVGAGVFALLAFGSLIAAVVAGAVVGGIFMALLGRGLPGKVELRMAKLKKRLPFTVDLMALMMEAGASFQEALRSAVQELPGHPLGEELSQLLRDIDLGRPRAEALRALQLRLNDDDISEIVFAVIKGEELGTPLAQILRTQAEQMRLKRSQWAEKASGIAQVNIVFPGMLIMVACLVLVVAPFILQAVFGGID
jgi:tight adherence protein C